MNKSGENRGDSARWEYVTFLEQWCLGPEPPWLQTWEKSGLHIWLVAAAETVPTAIPSLSSWADCAAASELSSTNTNSMGNPRSRFRGWFSALGRVLWKWNRPLSKSPFIPSRSSRSWGPVNSDACGDTESQITWDSDQGSEPSLLRLEKQAWKSKYGSRPVNLNTRLGPWERTGETGSEFASPLGRRKWSLAKWKVSREFYTRLPHKSVNLSKELERIYTRSFHPREVGPKLP